MSIHIASKPPMHTGLTSNLEMTLYKPCTSTYSWQIPEAKFILLRVRHRHRRKRLRNRPCTTARRVLEKEKKTRDKKREKGKERERLNTLCSGQNYLDLLPDQE